VQHTQVAEFRGPGEREGVMGDFGGDGSMFVVDRRRRPRSHSRSRSPDDRHKRQRTHYDNGDNSDRYFRPRGRGRGRGGGRGRGRGGRGGYRDDHFRSFPPGPPRGGGSGGRGYPDRERREAIDRMRSAVIKLGDGALDAALLDRHINGLATALSQDIFDGRFASSVIEVFVEW
jgi:hypothetical protein